MGVVDSEPTVDIAGTAAATPASEPPALQAQDSSAASTSEEESLEQELQRLTHELEVTREELESALGRSSELGLALMAASAAPASKPVDAQPSTAAQIEGTLAAAATTAVPAPAAQPSTSAPRKAARQRRPWPLPLPVPRVAPLMCPWPQDLPLSDEATLAGNTSLTFSYVDALTGTSQQR